MKYAIIYWTRLGNNKKIADYLAEKLAARGEASVFTTDEVDPSAMPEADVYIFSAAAEVFRVQKNMRKLMKRMSGMEGKKYGIINTHGMQKKNWLAAMENPLAKKKMVKLAEAEFAMSKEDKESIQAGWERKLDAFISKL